MTSYISSSLADTQNIGVKIAATLNIGDVILLYGDLGVGKTALARAIIESISIEDNPEVTSPTFNILQIYDVQTKAGKSGQIYHYDLYRLDSEGELQEIGFDENLEESITIIEWPEKALSYIVDKPISITITINDKSRNICVTQ